MCWLCSRMPVTITIFSFRQKWWKLFCVCHHFSTLDKHFYPTNATWNHSTWTVRCGCSRKFVVVLLWVSEIYSIVVILICGGQIKKNYARKTYISSAPNPHTHTQHGQVSKGEKTNCLHFCVTKRCGTAHLIPIVQ